MTNSENFSLEDIFLAALFHDIGKMYQRAYQEKKQYLQEKYRNIIKTFKFRGVPHQIWSMDFIENHEFLKDKKNVISGVLHHHTKGDNFRIALIVSIADRISASEREDYKPSDDLKEYEAKELVSVFSSVKLREGNNPKDWFKLIERYSIGTFPKQLPNTLEETKKDYRKLWEDFVSQIQKEKDLERLYYILKEYTSNIPSAYYYSKPSISLFAHSVSTAAVAVALYKQFEEKIESNDFSFIEKLEKQINNPQYENQEKVLGVIKGDLSGIQNFIYNISMEGALRKLKGRSFYLEMLIHLIGLWIAESEGLTIANLIMSGGGHFYLIVPARTIDRLEEYRKRVDEIIYSAHKNKIAVIIAGEKFSLREFQNFSEIFERLAQENEVAKLRKFEFKVKNESEEFFEPIESHTDDCPYCGRRMKNGICEFCESFEELGTQLAKNTYMILKRLSRRQSQQEIRSCLDVFKNFGFEILFTNKENEKAILIKKSNDFDFKNSMTYLGPSNYIPTKYNSEIKSLDEISLSAEGIKSWGILRGDVDNLGKIFRNGLGEDRSLSKVLTLSEEFKLFFGFHLERIISENSKFEDCIVVYSGGDDFLIIGPWSVLPDLAEQIRYDFQKFTCENIDLSISMAISVTADVKHPIYRVANEAGEMLEKAKDYERRNLEKNALHFMDENIGWEEWEKFKNIATTIENIISRSQKRSLLNHLYAGALEQQRAIDKKTYPRSWRLVYHLANYGGRYSLKKQIDNLLEQILEKRGNKIYSKLYGCIRWIDFKTRK